MVACAGINPSHHRSGTSIDHPTRISKIGNATLRLSLHMPALSALCFNPAVAPLVARPKSAGRLKSKQIVVAATRKLLVIFDPRESLKMIGIAIRTPELIPHAEERRANRRSTQPRAQGLEFVQRLE